MKKFLLRALVVQIWTLLAVVSAHAQIGSHHIDIAVTNIDGTVAPVSFAQIRVCVPTAVNTPCTPQASIYSDVNLTVPLSQPITADANGNFDFYALPGFYQIQISSLHIPTVTQNWVVLPQVAGNLSNVTFQTNGVNNFSQSILNLVSTSSVTVTNVSGGNVTFTVNGAGTGTVTNFFAGNLPPLFTTSVATPQTTPTLSFALSNTAGGTVFGNPSGSSGAPSYTPNPVLGIPGTTLGSLGLAGNVSGVVTIEAQPTGSSWTFKWPTNAGTPGYFLSTDGTGVGSWIPIPAVTFQTNGVNNTSQSLLNLVAGPNITITNTSGGSVQISASGSGNCSISGTVDTQFIFNDTGACASNPHFSIDYSTTQAIDGLGIYFNPAGMSGNADNPTVTPSPSGGHTTWSYQIVARYGILEGGPGSTGQTTTGPTTLNASNFNTVTWASVPGAVSYDVYRANGVCCGGTGSGRIGNTTSLTFNDTGQSAEDNAPVYGTDFNINTTAVGFNGFSLLGNFGGQVYIGEPQSNLQPMGIQGYTGESEPLQVVCKSCAIYAASFVNSGSANPAGLFVGSWSGAGLNSVGPLGAQITAENPITSGTGIGTLALDISSFNVGNGNAGTIEGMQVEWGINADLGGSISGTANFADAILILSPETQTSANPAIGDAAGIEIQNMHAAKVTTSYAIHLLSQNSGGFQIKTEGTAPSDFGGPLEFDTMAAPSNPPSGKILIYADSTSGFLTCLTSGGGNCLSSITLQHNGTANGSQSILNIKAGSSITVTDDGVGGITIASTGGGGGTTPGGSPGQIQYNCAGAFCGFTASGGATINTSTGIVTLGNPGASTLGGIESITCASHTWVNLINTSGVPSCTQPAFTDISGTLAVSQGGSGAATFTVHGVLLGEGTSAFGVTTAGTLGQCFLSNGSTADPSFQSCPGGTPAFSVIASGTNTTAAMLVGTGASLEPTGTGIIESTAFAVSPSQCSANQASSGIAANGNANCFNIFYQTIDNNGTPVTQRLALNFSTMFAFIDSPSPSRTSIDLSGVDVIHGGTGFLTALQNAILFGNGTSPIGTLTPPSDSQNYFVMQDGNNPPNLALAGVSTRVVTGTSDTIASGDRGGGVWITSVANDAETVPTAGGTGFGSNWISNIFVSGAGTATFTPVSGTINGVSSWPVPQGNHCGLFSPDNANWLMPCSPGILSAGAGIVLTPSPWGNQISANGYPGFVSASALTLSSTVYLPVGGGGVSSTTETNVDIESPTAQPISHLYVQLSAAPGAGNSVTITLRDGAVSKTVTCTVSGASATTCNDATHSFTPAVGDLLDWQISVSGTIVATPNLMISYRWGQ